MANPRRRRRAGRRRSYRRNQAIRLRGFSLPDFGQVMTGVAAGVGSKWLGRQVFPRGSTMMGGWGGPLTTLGAGMLLGFLLPMIGMRRFASSAVTGAATIAALDAFKLTPFGAQLGGVYTAPGEDVPVLSGGAIGMFPAGFQDPSLAQGGEYGFDMENDFLSE